MARWKLKDKNGKYRSSRAFKMDCAEDSEEPWEIRRVRKQPILSRPLKKLKKWL